MNRLLEDDSVKIRLFICQSFEKLFEQSGEQMPLDYLVKICSGIHKINVRHGICTGVFRFFFRIDETTR